jgi:hypothetical protein
VIDQKPPYEAPFSANCRNMAPARIYRGAPRLNLATDRDNVLLERTGNDEGGDVLGGSQQHCKCEMDDFTHPIFILSCSWWTISADL